MSPRLSLILVGLGVLCLMVRPASAAPAGAPAAHSVVIAVDRSAAMALDGRWARARNLVGALALELFSRNEGAAGGSLPEEWALVVFDGTQARLAHTFTSDPWVTHGAGGRLGSPAAGAERPVAWAVAQALRYAADHGASTKAAVIVVSSGAEPGMDTPRGGPAAQQRLLSLLQSLRNVAPAAPAAPAPPPDLSGGDLLPLGQPVESFADVAAGLQQKADAGALGARLAVIGLGVAQGSEAEAQLRTLATASGGPYAAVSVDADVPDAVALVISALLAEAAGQPAAIGATASEAVPTGTPSVTLSPPITALRVSEQVGSDFRVAEGRSVLPSGSASAWLTFDYAGAPASAAFEVTWALPDGSEVTNQLQARGTEGFFTTWLDPPSGRALADGQYVVTVSLAGATAPLVSHPFSMGGQVHVAQAPPGVATGGSEGAWTLPPPLDSAPSSPSTPSPWAQPPTSAPPGAPPTAPPATPEGPLAAGGTLETPGLKAVLTDTFTGGAATATPMTQFPAQIPTIDMYIECREIPSGISLDVSWYHDGARARRKLIAPESGTRFVVTLYPARQDYVPSGHWWVTVKLGEQVLGSIPFSVGATD